MLRYVARTIRASMPWYYCAPTRRLSARPPVILTLVIRLLERVGPSTADNSVAMTYDPVFIVGAARSGTSLLYRTLQKHSSFAPREVSLVETKILDYVNLSHRFTPEWPPNLLPFLLDDRQAFDRFLDSIGDVRRLHARIDTGAIRRLAARSVRLWKLFGNDRVLRAYFRESVAARGVLRLVEKSPNHVSDAAKLLCAFPRCRILFIYRHPLEVYTSFVRRSKVDTQACWARLLIEGFCRRYRSEIRHALECAARRPDAFKLIRYEHFTEQPQAEFGDLCDFLGEKYEPSAVIEERPDDGRYAIDPLLYGAITPSSKDWRQFISLEDGARIETELAPEMIRLRYERKTLSS